MMCRGGVVPCWRRKSTLIWTVLILGAVTYFVYSRTHRHKSLSQIFMSQSDGDDDHDDHPDAGGFWEKHGGDEIDRKLGKIKFRTRYKQKPRHRPQQEEEYLYDDDDEEVEHDDRDEREDGRRGRDREEERGREEMRRRGHGAIDREDDKGGRGDIQRPVENRNDEDEDENDEDEDEDEDENVITKEEIHRKVEEEDRAVKEQVEVKEDAQESEERLDKWDKNGIEEANAVQEAIEIPENYKKDKKDANPIVKEEKGDIRNPVNKEEANRAREVHRQRMEALKRKIEFGKKKAAAHMNKEAGVVDAALPDKETLTTWPDDRIEALFHNYVMLPQTKCAIVSRMGKKTHGGWDICHLEGYRPIQPCLMYSFGIKGDYTFEDDVARRYGCETHYFDPEIPTYMDGKRRSSGVYTHAYLLSSDDGLLPTGWKVKKLSTLKQMLNHEQPIDILKVDIEENEWRSLPEMLMSGVLGKVRQFLLEVHVLFQGRPARSKSEYIKHLMILRDLYIDGFRIARTRADETKLRSREGITRSQNYEILFLRKEMY